jgi:hypothetical protein
MHDGREAVLGLDELLGMPLDQRAELDLRGPRNLLHQRSNWYCSLSWSFQLHRRRRSLDSATPETFNHVRGCAANSTECICF